MSGHNNSTNPNPNLNSPQFLGGLDSMDLPIHEKSAGAGGVMAFIKKKGLVATEPVPTPTTTTTTTGTSNMKHPGHHYQQQQQQNLNIHHKRTSIHASGAETDTEVVGAGGGRRRNVTYSPPRTPPAQSGGGGGGRRLNFTRKGAVGYEDIGASASGGGGGGGVDDAAGLSPEMYGLVGQGRRSRARSAGFVNPTTTTHTENEFDDEEDAKKEEDEDEDMLEEAGLRQSGVGDDGYPGRGRRKLGGGDDTIGSNGSLTFMSSITSEQWKELGDGEEVDGLLDGDGDDEESEIGDVKGKHHYQQQQQRFQEWNNRPQFAGGDSGVRARGYEGSGIRIAAFNNPRQQQQQQQQHHQQAESEDGNFTDDYGGTQREHYGDDQDHTQQQQTHHPQAQQQQQQPFNHRPYPPSSPTLSSDEDTTTITDPHPHTEHLTVDGLIALEYSAEGSAQRMNYIREHCPTIAEWNALGQAILERQAAVTREMMKAREERLKTVERFERELEMAEGAVEERMAKTRQYMARFKAGVEMYM
ncbi:hypothetical protein DFH27DRAFT_273111 [Peziza echinospora]|nr:hypothetical protein DFH27DRAFT_273111 [Peziza echinospora]